MVTKSRFRRGDAVRYLDSVGEDGGATYRVLRVLEDEVVCCVVEGESRPVMSFAGLEISFNCEELVRADAPLPQVAA